MANRRTSTEFAEYVTVDTAPESVDTGYFTNAISIRKIRKDKKIRRVFFSIREFEADPSEASAASDLTVTLQFKCPGDEGWTDYVSLDGSTLAIGNRLMMEDLGAGIYWRAGIKPDNFASGQVRFGFDW